MRIAVTLVFVFSALPACTVTIPEGEFTCSYASGATRDSTCPPGFFCHMDDRCYSTGPVDLGVDDQGTGQDLGTTGCFSDADCDGNAHCDAGTCLPDLSDGSTCDEASDCISSYCGNGYCCSGGDCCASASNCPASYASPPICADPATCQGTRSNAVCTGNVCGTSPEIDDDSACTASTLANSCGTYTDVFCNGQVTQSAPTCGTTCSGNAQCDASANCSGSMCVSNGANGDACSANNQCVSDHCQNGYCCATGDCCNVAANCPGSYSNAATCDTPSSCQGTRDDAVCNASKQCTTTANVPDDSACTAATTANSCGFYNDVSCTGAISQTAPTCPMNCTMNSQCDPGSFCGSNICQPLRTQGQTCVSAAECTAGLACADGVCCNNSCGSLCRACNVAGSVGTCSNIPAGWDPAGECGMVSCAGWYAGWTGDVCNTAQNAPAAAVDCNGSGACEGAPQVCPVQAVNGVALDCNNLCQAPNLSTCTGMVAPVCDSVTPPC